MDTRAFLVLGILCATTSGFIQHFSRRDDGAAERAQRPNAQYQKSMNCRVQSILCDPIKPMMDSMFSGHRGRKFVINNQLQFSCSAGTKASLYSCASGVRSNCGNYTKWIDGFTGFYDDLCAMEPVLLGGAACMNSRYVSKAYEKCSRIPSNICLSITTCVRYAFDSEPRCSLQFKTKFLEAATAMLSTQFGSC